MNQPGGRDSWTTGVEPPEGTTVTAKSESRLLRLIGFDMKGYQPVGAILELDGERFTLAIGDEWKVDG